MFRKGRYVIENVIVHNYIKDIKGLSWYFAVPKILNSDPIFMSWVHKDLVEGVRVCYDMNFSRPFYRI